jgi:hypothetical protein
VYAETLAVGRASAFQPWIWNRRVPVGVEAAMCRSGRPMCAV